jgi:hypothetical protein
VRPVGRTSAAVLSSLRRTRGFERFLDYLFYQVAAVNGFDSVGHYLRAGMIVNQCSVYSTEPTPGCTANFSGAGASSASASSASGPRDPVLQATADAIARALAGESTRAKDEDSAKRTSAPRLQATPSPSPSPTASPTPAPSTAPATRQTPVPTPTPPPSDEPLLDYLFGKDTR